MTDRKQLKEILGNQFTSGWADRILGALEPGESVVAAGIGVFKAPLLGKDSTTSGFVVCTNLRVLKMTENVIGTKEFDSIPLEMISAVDETTMLFGIVSLSISASNASIEATGKGLKGLAAVINKERRRKKDEPSPSLSTSSPLEQIEKLGQLLEKGLITKEEFDEKKKALLERL